MSRLVTAPLHAIAHGRAGDKGERVNISVIPYTPAAWPVLLEQATEEAVLAVFAHRGATRVVRYELPLLPALNFVIDDALQGGVNESLGLDGHGKTLSFLLLGALTVTAPLEAFPAGSPWLAVAEDG